MEIKTKVITSVSVKKLSWMACCHGDGFLFTALSSLAKASRQPKRQQPSAFHIPLPFVMGTQCSL